MNIKDITITSLETITAFDITTGNYKFTLDELQSASLGQSEEKTPITGKQGRKLTTLKKNKAVTISGTNGLVSGGLLELQTGGKFKTETSTEVLWTDYLTVESKSATTKYTAIGTAGNEIKEVQVKDSNGVITKTLTQNSTAASGKFAYAPTTKTLTFADGDVSEGSEIIVHYKRKIAADVLENKSDKFSEKCALYIDAFAEDKCANVYRIQFYIPKADFNGEFSLEMGENQTVHAFEAEALAGACGSDGALWTYTIFGVNANDVTSA